MKNKNLLFLFILLIVFTISVGYAVINRTLNITGSSEVVTNTWNIHFENIKIRDGSVSAIKEPTIDNSKLAVSFAFNLDLPGDFYEFTVDLVNSGTIDAMIESIVKTPELTEEQAKYLNYVVSYENNEQIISKQLVESNSFVRIKVRVEYRNTLTENELPTIYDTLNLGFELKSVQSDNTAILIKNNGIIGANGDINEIGTIVTIGTEQFYTIGTNGDNVKLLSMYNLYVGKTCTDDYFTYCINYGNQATGMQNKDMLGLVNDQANRNGVTVFSSSEQKGENYGDYKGSIVEIYVNDYKNLLEINYSVNIEEARLITMEELMDFETFACDLSESTCLDSPYPFIYSTSYWINGVNYEDRTKVYYVYSYGRFRDYYYNYDFRLGVRPVIVISKSYF